jgi:hypothetical protein
MVDTADLKSVAFKGVPVRVRPAVFSLFKLSLIQKITDQTQSRILAFFWVKLAG